VDEQCTSLPFGNDVGNPVAANCTAVANSLGTNDDATEHHFTQKERDTETGNDYFYARYYSSALGRFTTPDWSAKVEPIPYAKMGDPQSLNLYAYVGNNPIIHVDADGHSAGWDRLIGSNITGAEAVMNMTGKTIAEGGGRDLLAQQQIANNAANQEGSGTYEYDHSKGSFPAGKNKCNEFVADTIDSSGVKAPSVPKSGILGWLGFTRPLTAKEWATMSISGWSAPDSVANARPGDVIAMGHHDDSEGHVGIVVGAGLTASVNANTHPGGIVTVNDWGFRASGQNQEHPGDAVVVRHYIGDGQ
jgi:RHS repeat-associated protein